MNFEFSWWCAQHINVIIYHVVITTDSKCGNWLHRKMSERVNAFDAVSSNQQLADWQWFNCIRKECGAFWMFNVFHFQWKQMQKNREQSDMFFAPQSHCYESGALHCIALQQNKTKQNNNPNKISWFSARKKEKKIHITTLSVGCTKVRSHVWVCRACMANGIRMWTCSANKNTQLPK